ncbi:MAG: hypothetical protein WC254_03440 [Candidatus Woesearchaeota archaeon]|jgi:hypothetical protein
MTMPEELKLVRIPLSDRVLYLYPEYVSQAQRFGHQESEQHKFLGGTRGCHLIIPGSAKPYVAKPERDETSNNGGIHNFLDLTPDCGSFTVQEVSVARALYLRAGYIDDDISITFERPYGFMEKDGKRVGLFQYNPDLHICPNATNHRYVQWQKGIEGWDRESRLKAVTVKYLLFDLAFPKYFANLILKHNGVCHNESFSKWGAYLKNYMPTIFVDDFELVTLASQTYDHDNNTGLQVWRNHYIYLKGLSSNLQAPLSSVNELLQFLPKKSAQQDYEEILRAIERMEERILAYPSVGPAGPLINAIANMQDISEVILT